MTSRDLIQTLDGTEWIKSVCLAGDGLIASASEDKNINLWDMKTGRNISRLQGHEHHVRCVVHLSSGLIVSGSFDTTIKVWDPQRREVIQTLQHGDDVKCACGLDEAFLASGGLDNNIKLWDLRTGECVKVLSGHRHCVQSVCQLNDKYLASGSTDCTVMIWNVNTGVSVATLREHTRTVWSVCPAGDGLLASAGMDRLIKIWNIHTHKCVRTLTGHNDSVFTITLIGDHLVASGSQDATVKIWDTKTFQCLQTLNGHTKGVSCICKVGPNTICSGSFDTSINVWRVEELTKRMSLVEEKSGLIDAMLEDNNVDVENLHQKIDMYNLTDERLLLKRDFLSAIKNKDQASALCLIEQFQPQLYIFQTYIEQALKKEMQVFQERFRHITPRKQKSGLLDPHDYTLMLENFRTLWNERNDNTELLMNLWTKCSSLHIDKMASLTTEFDNKSMDYKTLELQLSKLVETEKPETTYRMQVLEAEIKMLKQQLQSKENELHAELLKEYQIDNNIQQTDVQLKSIETRKVEIQSILETHRTQTTSMNQLTEEVNSWRKNMYHNLQTFQARLTDIKRKFELQWRVWEPKHVINWITSLDKSFPRKYRLTLQQKLPHQISMGQDLEYMTVAHIGSLGIIAVRDRVLVHKEIQRIIHLDSEGVTAKTTTTKEEDMREQSWKTWKPQDTINWICSLDRTWDIKYRSILSQTVPAQILIGDDLQYMDVDLLVDLGIDPLPDRGRIMANIQRVMKLNPSLIGNTTFE